MLKFLKKKEYLKRLLQLDGQGESLLKLALSIPAKYNLKNEDKIEINELIKLVENWNHIYKSTNIEVKNADEINFLIGEDVVLVESTIDSLIKRVKDIEDKYR